MSLCQLTDVLIHNSQLGTINKFEKIKNNDIGSAQAIIAF
jgi:hypothetical protein